MTDLRAAAQQALEALDAYSWEQVNAARAALRAALAEPVQEPVAWIHEDELPSGYPYDLMFPHSKVDGVRLFPVFVPAPDDTALLRQCLEVMGCPGKAKTTDEQELITALRERLEGNK